LDNDAIETKCDRLFKKLFRTLERQNFNKILICHGGPKSLILFFIQQVILQSVFRLFNKKYPAKKYAGICNRHNNTRRPKPF
jgi:hypothetical protein